MMTPQLLALQDFERVLKISSDSDANWQPADEIASEFEKRIPPNLKKHFEIQPQLSFDGDAYMVRITFSPNQPGPWVGLDLSTPDLSTPVTKLSVKQYRKLNGLVLKPKTGPVLTIINYVIDWFSQLSEELLKNDENPTTASELAQVLRKGLDRIPGIDAQVENSLKSVHVQVLGMDFLIGEGPRAKFYPAPVGNALPQDMAVRGTGPFKFRTMTGPAWSVVEELLQWVKKMDSMKKGRP